MRAGATVLHAGRRLGPVQLGAAVAAGAGTLQTAPKPRVAVLCTGDELRAPGEPLGPGEIHNSNAPMLTGLFKLNAGADAGAAGRLPDDRQATIDGIAAAIDTSEVVIITGGVSVGPHDHVKPALSALHVRQLFLERRAAARQAHLVRGRRRRHARLRPGPATRSRRS